MLNIALSINNNYLIHCGFILSLIMLFFLSPQMRYGGYSIVGGSLIFYVSLILSEKINFEVKKFHNHPVLVLSGNYWHEGVIGIIASRIKEKYNKPAILISLNKKIGKGSARSLVGFDIGSQIIKAVQSNILIKGGGHKMAGGFTIKEEKISEFRDFLIYNFE